MTANRGNKRLMAKLSKTERKPSPSNETKEIRAGKQAGQLKAPIQILTVPILSNLKFTYII